MSIHGMRLRAPSFAKGVRRTAVAAGVLSVAILTGCVSAPDEGAKAVSTFFSHLEQHQFDAAADMVRDSATTPMSQRTRDQYIAGWRKAYEGYAIRFTSILVRAIGPAPSEAMRAAGASEGYVYDVKFEGTSNSPCVPVSSDVIPGTTRPVAMRAPDGAWFLTTESIVGFVYTCPGG